MQKSSRNLHHERHTCHTTARWGMGGLLEPEGRKAFHLKLCHLASFHSAMGAMASSPKCILFLGIHFLHFGDCQNHPKSLWIVLLSNKFLCTVQCYMSHAVLPIQSVLQCRHVFPAYLVSIFLGRWSSLDLSVMHRKIQKEFLKRIITLLSLLSTKVKWWNKLGMVNMYHHAVMVKRDKLILHLLRWTKLMENP